MPQTKATKKFEKNRLKDTLKRRKDFKKIKQKIQQNDKRKARRAKDNEKAEDVAEAVVEKGTDTSGNRFAEMSVDDFFQGGFEISEKDKKSKKNKKRKRADAEAEDDGEEAVDGTTNAIEPDDAVEGGSEDEFADHKQQLEALAKNDPEFYQHLKENDPELLDFANDADLAGIQLSESEDEAPKSKKQKMSKKKKKQAEAEPDEEDDLGDEASNEITIAMVEKWHAAMTEKHSLRQMREVVMAFRAAVRSNEADAKAYKYSISNPEVYHELLLCSLKDIPVVLAHHLPTKEMASGKLRVPTDSKQYSKLAPIIKSHAGSIQYLLSTLSDAATIKLTLSSVLPLLPYLLSFKKLLRELCRTTSSVWSSHSQNDATRIAAFLVLRRLTVIGDPGIRENALKSTYQGLVQSSRQTTVHTISGINLMKNSAVELWGLVDANQAYTMAFNFIRQLAIHLRSSIISKEKERHKTVYNFQFVNSLDFWSRVLSAHCSSSREAEAGKQSSLRPLIYPLVQICLGTMRLVPTPLYFPLRFQIVRSLLRVAKATDTYIPLAPALLEVLNSPECKKPPKPASLRPVDWETSVRVSKAYLKTRVWQVGLGEQVVELLGEWAGQWAKSIAFPELVLPVIVMLKRWHKEMSGSKGKPNFRQSGKIKVGNKNGKMNSAVALLVQKFESNARLIEERRARVDFAPNNRAGVEGFLKETAWEKTPLGAFLVGQRAVREERAKVVEEGRRADEMKKKSEDDEEKLAMEADMGGFEVEDADESDAMESDAGIADLDSGDED